MNSHFVQLFSVLLGIIFAASPVLASDDAERFVSAHRDFFRLYMPDQTEFKGGYRFEPSREEKDGPNELDLHDFWANLELPFPLTQDTFITFGAGYEMRQYDFNRRDDSVLELDSETLYKVAAPVGVGHFFSPDLLGYGVVSVGGYSNFEGGIKEDDIQVLGRGIMAYRLNAATQLVGGFAVSQDFEDAQLIPLLGLRLMSSDGRVHFILTAPLELKVSYDLDSDFQLYGGGWLSGNQFRVRDVGGEDFDVQVRDARVGLGLMYWIGDHLSLGVEGGAKVWDEFEFKLEHFDEFEGELDPGAYVQATIGLAL